jgi:hypothetical protein
MYIEFQLPSNSGLAAGNALAMIKAQIHRWSEQHKIPYTSKTIKYTHRVCFENDKLYTFFSITWNPEFELPRWRIVSDLNNRT